MAYNLKASNWTPTEFWGYDSNAQRLCDIYLSVDFGYETVSVRAVWRNDGMSDRTYNGFEKSFLLPYNTDFSEFGKYYDDEIRPIIEKLDECFSSDYDGRNYVGRFTGDETDDLLFELEEKLEEDNIPTHTIRPVHSMTVDEYWDNYRDILKSVGIDMLTADFGDSETLNTAIEALEGVIDEAEDEIVDMGYEFDLKRLQSKLIEEIED